MKWSVIVALLSLGMIGSEALIVQAQERNNGRVTPGDQIRIRAWMAETMDGQYDVDERGEVILPRLGRVKVGGLTASEVRDSLQAAYAEFLRGGLVDVRVLRRVGVGGEVSRPTLYWVDPTISLRDAIALAGGITTEGDRSNVVLIREGARIRIDLDDTSSDSPTPLFSGDQLVVARKGWFALNTPLIVTTSVSLLTVVAGFLIVR